MGTSIFHIGYGMAYFLLPHYAYSSFQRLEELQEQWSANAEGAGPFFYLMACQMQKVEPDEKSVRLFRSEKLSLPQGQVCHLFSYPEPSPLKIDPNKLPDDNTVLAPFFSAVMQSREGNISYYVLGQAPFGGTTLRSVPKEGTNCNLGPGPDPIREAFLAVIGERPVDGIE